jgi:hypothetical protein
MRVRIIPVSAVLLTAACATVPQASLEDRTLSYGCNDIVVVASVRNGAFEHVQIANDILGHGWISATLHVRKVVRGPDLPAVLPVRYFAHTYMRQDRNFMLVLKHSGSGYEIRTGQVMFLRPLLASHCE